VLLEVFADGFRRRQGRHVGGAALQHQLEGRLAGAVAVLDGVDAGQHGQADRVVAAGVGRHLAPVTWAAATIAFISSSVKVGRVLPSTPVR
jgi:hypothetical protein